MDAPRDCPGGNFGEAIGALNVRAAELRLRAAQIGQDNACGHPYGDWKIGFDGLHDEAKKLDELAAWLRKRGWVGEEVE